MFMSHNCWSHLMYFTEGRHHSVMWSNVNELRWPDPLNTTCSLIFIRLYHLIHGNSWLNKRKRSVFYKDLQLVISFLNPLFLSLIWTASEKPTMFLFSHTSPHTWTATQLSLIICHFNLRLQIFHFHTELCSPLHSLILRSLIYPPAPIKTRWSV